MATPYPRNLRYIQSGDSVSAGVANSPTQTLAKRTDSLKERLDAALLGAALAELGAVIESSAVVAGMAVYRDASGTYRPAHATTEVANSLLQLTEAGYPWGVVSQKDTNTSGVVILAGKFQLTEAQLEAVTVSGQVETGLMFVSATPGKAGKLTSTRPPIGVPICMVSGPDGTDDEGNALYSVLVSPSWRSSFDDHVHFSARLVSTIDPASSNPGWEDVAAWELATGLSAPADAVYRYRHEDQDDLADIWPPIPIEAVHFDLDGVASDTLEGFPVLIDETGIFWTSASLNPDDYDRHDFYFLRMTFKNADSVVTRLRPLDSSVVIQDADGADAEVGELYIGVNVDLTSGSDNVVGQAVKDLSGLTGQIGPVVDGVRSGTPSTLGVTGSGTFSSGGATYYKGNVVLTVIPSDSRERVVSAIELDGVQVKTDGPITYLAMPTTGGAIYARIEVPEIGLDVDLDVSLTLELWGKATGTMPDLDISAEVVPTLTTTAVALSPSLSAVATIDDFPAVSADDALRRTVSVATAVAPGSLVYVKIERAGSDGYNGDVGVLAIKWSVEATSGDDV